MGPSFNAEWRKQNFFFCDLPDLEYGLIQYKVGLKMAIGVNKVCTTDLTISSLHLRSNPQQTFRLRFGTCNLANWPLELESVHSVHIRVTTLKPAMFLLSLQGGPCGILACVQAHVLKHLLFSDPTKNLASRLADTPFKS